MENNITNNSVDISGQIISFVESHKLHDKTFYKFDIVVNRLSGVTDTIPCIVIDEVLKSIGTELIGYYVNVKGQFRSRNVKDGEKRKLVLYVYVKSIDIIDEECINTKFNNTIILNGRICSKPIYRKTPLNNRDIAEVILAVNDPYGRSDYIPCIFWNTQAKYVSKLEVSTIISLSGRIQSRLYDKVINNVTVTNTAYEISVNHMTINKDKN